MDERPLWTLDEVLWRLPSWIAQEFTCVRGPHDWRVVETRGPWIGWELHPITVVQFCLNCPARRHKEAA